MFRQSQADRTTLEIVHPRTGVVLLSIGCESRAEYVDLRFALCSALQEVCDMHDPARGVGPILTRCEVVREGEGFDDRGFWFVCEADLLTVPEEHRDAVRLFLQGKRVKILH